MTNNGNSNEYINLSVKTTVPIQKIFNSLGCVLDSSICGYFMTEKCPFYEYLRGEENGKEEY